jgi:glycine/D-amino acid oxidase-like deaminating enzyme
MGKTTGIEGLTYACGHYRNGILLAPVTGELIADVVLGKPTPSLLSAFAPQRFNFAAAN